MKKRMKKRFQAALICALLLFGLNAQAIDYRDEIYQSDNPATIYSDMPITGSLWVRDTLYMLGDSLRSYVLGDNKIETIATYAADGVYFDESRLHETPSVLATDGEVLYGLSEETGVFGPIVQGYIQKNIQLEWDKILINGEPRYIQWAEIVGSVLYCSVRRPDYLDEVEAMQMQTVAFRLDDGKYIGIIFDMSTKICAFRDNTLLVYNQDSGLFVYNQETGNTERQLLTISGYMDDENIPTIGYATNSLYYSKEEDIIFFQEAFYGEQTMPDGTREFRDELRVRSMPGDGGAPETVCVLPARYASSAMLSVTAAHLICRVRDSVFIVER